MEVPRKLGAVGLVAALALVGTAGTAAAGHLAPATSHCTYEFPEVEAGPGVDFAIDDPMGLTADDAFNKTVCIFYTPDTDPGENSPIGPAHVVVSGVNTIPGQYGTAQAAIVDDTFGTNIGGRMCADFNHDHRCGDPDEGEPAASFCGTSPVISVGRDTDGDGHADFGWGFIVAVNSYWQQTMFCDPLTAPTSTMGGILNPAGGIYMTVGS